MKTLVNLLATTAFIASSVCGAHAEGYAKKRKHGAKQHYYGYSSPESGHNRRHPQPDEWYERLADKLPIGSFAWWDQMRREGRVNR
jgi:hypothetical protein